MAEYPLHHMKANLLDEAYENLIWFCRSRFSDDLDMLRANLDRIDWRILSENEHVLPILLENPDKIDWNMLSANPAAIDLLRANRHRIDWRMLAQNSAAIDMLRNRLDFSNWLLQFNPAAVPLLMEHPDKINWCYLSGNPGAISVLQANPKKIDWHHLSANPAAMHLLKANPEKIQWDSLSANPAAIDMLLEHPERIDWEQILENPNAEQLLMDPRVKRAYHMTYLRKFASTALAWCDPDAVDWEYVSKTTNDLGLLKANLNRVDWWWANINPTIIPLLEEHPEHLCISMLVGNPCSQAMDIVEQHMDELDDCEWFKLLKNPAAVHLIDECPEEFMDMSVVSANPGAIEMLSEDEFYDSFFLYKNPNAFKLISADDPDIGSISKNPCMLPLLKQHISEIDWWKFSKNPNPEAVQVLKEHPRKIDYSSILKNPNLLTYDYAAMRDERGELMASLAGHPRFIEQYVIENF